MNQLAKTLMQLNSYKDRQNLLNGSLDCLSFNYPDVYIQLFKEIKKRERESNDINKITEWTNSHVKFHEALILVRSNNVMAKEKYLESLKLMFCQTIENGNNIEATLKICSLIENSIHLSTFHE